MEFEIKTLETSETITAELSDVGAVYSEDDVVYINGSFGSVPCRLSSARYIQKEEETNNAKDVSLIEYLLLSFFVVALIFFCIFPAISFWLDK